MPCMEHFAAPDERIPRPGAAAASAGRASRSRRRARWAGIAGSVTWARRSACRPSVPRLRPSALYQHFGFTPEHIAATARNVVARANERTDDEEVAESNPQLKALTEAGVSVWLDQIRRSLVEGGELARMVAEESAARRHLNPSIFEKAILGSNDYDDALEDASPATSSSPGDLRATRAARRPGGLLTCSRRSTRRPAGATASSRSRWRRTWRTTPRARSSTARTYWQAVDRPNVLIKIPGTPEGVPAIEQAIYEGINVNVTLLFAVEAYEAVAERLHPRARAPPRRGQVARRATRWPSFFVSRVDTPRRQARSSSWAAATSPGTAAVANARAAYRRFKEIFAGERWERLAAGRRGRAAAAVGLDRAPRTRPTRHQVRRRADRARTPSTRCRSRR